ncbi:hypothetical protein [Neptunomonas phycophila]|uniref:hypothetical protein n=1 Tax=Neptunomonas phycophila TaxID=1572645 RepID=UPI0037359336
MQRGACAECQAFVGAFRDFAFVVTAQYTDWQHEAIDARAMLIRSSTNMQRQG